MIELNHICPENGRWPFKAGLLPYPLTRPRLIVKTTGEDKQKKGYFPLLTEDFSTVLYSPTVKVRMQVSFFGLTNLNYCAHFNLSTLECQSNQTTNFNTMAFYGEYIFSAPSTCPGEVTVSGFSDINPIYYGGEELLSSWGESVGFGLGFLQTHFHIQTNNGFGVWAENMAGGIILQTDGTTLSRIYKTNGGASYLTDYQFKLKSNTGDSCTVTARLQLIYSLSLESSTVPQATCKSIPVFGEHYGFDANYYATRKDISQLALGFNSISPDNMPYLDRIIDVTTEERFIRLKAEDVCPYFAGATITFRPVWKTRSIGRGINGFYYGEWQNAFLVGEWQTLTLTAGDCESAPVEIPAPADGKSEVALDYIEFEGGLPYVRP